MFKRSDYIIISVILFFFGIFVVSQYNSSKTYLKVVTPENNETMALEVARLTKSNSDLRNQVKNLTLDLDTYKNSSESKKALYDKYSADIQSLNVVNGLAAKTGQGIAIKVQGTMSTAQIVDLVNAIKNIGSDVIAINNSRVMINSDMAVFANQPGYEILVYGNSKLLKSSMERKGGIVDQIITKDIKISLQERDEIEIPAGQTLNFKYSRPINN